MIAAPHAVLEAARTQAGMSHQDLWIGYFALGGGVEPRALRAYLAGETAEPVEYDVLAHAINECFLDQGRDHPVPYLEEFD